jgi:hypothetical protein
LAVSSAHDVQTLSVDADHRAWRRISPRAGSGTDQLVERACRDGERNQTAK